jgi:uncharacterized protein
MSAGDREPTMNDDNLPWYRQGWPWFLISLPATAVVAGLVTYYIAARGFDGPVVADYYKQGLAINEEIGRSQLGRSLGIEAKVAVDGLAAGERVRVELVSAQPLPPEVALRVRLVHPGKRDADRLAILARADVAPDNRSAVYVGEWQTGVADERLAAHPVAWQVVVETQQWRIDDSFTAGGRGVFRVRAR